MATTFDSAITRLNAGVSARLANAMASVDGGTAFPLLFDNDAEPLLNAAIARSPRAACEESALGAATVGAELAIVGGSTYTINQLEPDGAGWVEIGLELAP